MKQLNRFRKGAAVLLVAVSFGLTGCGKGSNKNVQIDGVQGPNVGFVDGTLTMSVVLTQVSLNVGARVEIPNMPNSYLEIGPDFQTNGTLISIGLAAQDITKLAGGDLLDPSTLPGGRPLPGVIDGQLPAIAVTVPKLDHIVFYVGPTVFGVFVPVALPWQNYIGTFRFYDGTGTQIGNISIVGEDQNKRNSGFLLLINLAGKVANLIAASPN